MAAMDKRGNKKHEHYTKVTWSLVSTSAWSAMSPKAQILYILLRFEWKGPQFNNNGNIRLSYRQAAKLIGIGVNAVMKAFHELQAKGFIVVTKPGALGVKGMARGPSYELTEIGMPGQQSRHPRRLYRQWKPGKDFEVIRHNR